MSFVDKAEVTLVAGNGGNGVVSFRHEKFIDKGGPDGGNGGHGGDIILLASNNENTLSDFRFHKLIKAEDGNPGAKTKKNGRGGKDLLLSVPLGTSVFNEEGLLVADLTLVGQQAVIAKGGRGGFGNAHFLSSTRQVPRVAEKGEKGVRIKATLELKMIADVGLIGLPNAGKSTLLSVLSNARPEIADYPFTTLTPNLGMVSISGQHNLLFADIPGLIEGAAKGKGLGDEFLRHVERTLVLVHLIDGGIGNIDRAYKTIQKELKSYRLDLTDRLQVVVLNKIDNLDDKTIKQQLAKLKKIIGKEASILAISAKTHKGLKELLFAIDKIVAGERERLSSEKENVNESIPILTLPSSDKSWEITRRKKDYIISGRKIERFAAQTDSSNPDSIQRLRDIMKKTGIFHELARQGVKNGDRIFIGNDFFTEY